MPHDSTLIMNDWFCWCWMNLKFYSQFHPRSRRNPNRGSVLHRQQTSSAFQTGNWREAVPQSCPLHLLWQRNLAHSEWPTDSPDPDTYNLKKHTQTQRTFWIKSSRHDYHKKLLWVVRGLKSRHVKLILKQVNFHYYYYYYYMIIRCMKLSKIVLLKCSYFSEWMKFFQFAELFM